MSAYLNGTRLPETVTLRQLAERTHVSLDWLVCGEGGNAPRYRGESRTRAELADDLAMFVEAEVKRLATDAVKDADEWGGKDGSVRADGTSILNRLAANCATEYADWTRAALHFRELAAAYIWRRIGETSAKHLERALKRYGKTLPPDVRKAATFALGSLDEPENWGAPGLPTGEPVLTTALVVHPGLSAMVNASLSGSPSAWWDDFLHQGLDDE